MISTFSEYCTLPENQSIDFKMLCNYCPAHLVTTRSTQSPAVTRLSSRSAARTSRHLAAAASQLEYTEQL